MSTIDRVLDLVAGLSERDQKYILGKLIGERPVVANCIVRGACIEFKPHPDPFTYHNETVPAVLGGRPGTNGAKGGRSD